MPLKDKIKSVTDFFKAPVESFQNDPSEEYTKPALGEDRPSLEYENQVPALKGKFELPQNPRKVKTPPEPSEEKEDFFSYKFNPTKGTVQLYEFTPKDPFPRMLQPGVDHSLLTLQYLQSMGYKRAVWFMSDQHQFFSHHNKCGIDPCEQNSSKEFYIEELIQHAHQHAGGGQYVCDLSNVKKLQRREQKINQMYNNKWYKIPLKDIAKLQQEILDIQAGTKTEKWKAYSPPSPIFSLSHPSCSCFLLCLDPLSAREIPDNAPGMPMFADPQVQQEFRQRIWDNIMALPAAGIEVHAYTLTPDPNSSFTEEIYMKEDSDDGSQLYASIEDRKKFAEEQWKPDIQPVITKDNVYMTYPMGITQPIMSGLKGFQIKSNNDLSLVYLVDMNHLVYVPTEHIEEIKFTGYEVPTSIERGDYVRISEEGTNAIIFDILADDTVLAFVPDFEEVVSIDNFEKMLII